MGRSTLIRPRSPPELASPACSAVCERWPHAPAETHSLCAGPRVRVQRVWRARPEHTASGPPPGRDDGSHTPAATPHRGTGRQRGRDRRSPSGQLGLDGLARAEQSSCSRRSRSFCPRQARAGGLRPLVHQVWGRVGKRRPGQQGQQAPCTPGH